MILLLFLFNIFYLNLAAYEEKIVGGVEVMNNAYPYIVSIGLLQNVSKTTSERQQQPLNVKMNTHKCTGVVINTNWVMLTTDCIWNYKEKQSYKVSDIGIGIGRNLNDIYDHGYIPVSQIIIKDGFNPKDELTPNNLALLKSSMDLSMQPACFATTTSSSSSSSSSSSLTNIGWGMTTPVVKDKQTGHSTPKVIRSNTLKQLQLEDTSSSSEKCQQELQFICTESIQPNQGPCFVDTANPLVRNDGTVVGILSTILPTPISDHEIKYCTGTTLFLRISKYMDWIKSNIKEPICEKVK